VTLLADRRRRDDSHNQDKATSHPPNELVYGVSDPSAVSILTEHSHQAALEEEHSSIRSGITINSSKVSRGSHHSYQSYQSTSRPLWVSSHHSSLSNQNSATKSCLKKTSTICSNAKAPIRRRSSDSIKVNFEDEEHIDECSSASAASDADSWASDDAMTLPSDCEDRDDSATQVDLPKEILPATTRINRSTAIAELPRTKETSEREAHSKEKKAPSKEKKVPSTREYTTFAPKQAAATASERRPIDSNAARDIGIRLKHKLKHLPSFEAPDKREKKRVKERIATFVADTVSQGRSQNRESSRVTLIVSAPPLDLAPQRVRTVADSSDRSVGSSSAVGSSSDDDEQVSEDYSCPPRQLTRRSSMARQENRQIVTERRGSVYRSLSSDQLGASRHCSDSPPKQICTSRRGFVSRCRSSDQLDARMGSTSSRRTLQRTSSSLLLDTDRKARPQALHRTDSFTTRTNHVDAPKIPTRSNSNGSRPGLARRSSSRTMSSRSLLPSISNSSCQPLPLDPPSRTLSSSGGGSFVLARSTSQRRFAPERCGSSTLSRSNSQRGLGLDRRPSSRTLCSSSSGGGSFVLTRSTSQRRLAPDRSGSSATLSRSNSQRGLGSSLSVRSNSNEHRPGMARQASSRQLNADRRVISNNDRQILQRVQSARGLQRVQSARGLFK
jgi:hypothetical protein